MNINWKKMIFFFCVYSISGWVLDTLVRTLQYKEFTAVNGLDGFPFSPMYGLGALSVLWMYRFIRQQQLVLQFFVYAVYLALFEYIGGVVSVVLHGYRLWDYSHIPFNIHGHTDLFHATAWGILALIIVHWLHPRLLKVFQQNQTHQNTEERESSVPRR